MDHARTWIAATAAMTLFACNANAEDSGFYVGGTLGQMRQTLNEHDLIRNSPAQGLPGDDTTGLSWGLTLGYHINQYLSAELSYLDSGSAKRVINGNSSSLNSRIRGMSGTLVPSWSFGAGFRGYARLGALFARDTLTYQFPNAPGFGYSDTFDHTTWLAGVGVGYSLNEHWNLNLEYVTSGKMQDDFPLGDNQLSGVSLGVRFQF